jgi:hypothetical protein
MNEMYTIQIPAWAYGFLCLIAFSYVLTLACDVWVKFCQMKINYYKNELKKLEKENER